MVKKAGKISISRMMCREEEDYIFVQVYDSTDKHIIDVKIALKSFAEAITGVGCTDCDIVDYTE